MCVCACVSVCVCVCMRAMPGSVCLSTRKVWKAQSISQRCTYLKSERWCTGGQSKCCCIVLQGQARHKAEWAAALPAPLSYGWIKRSSHPHKCTRKCADSNPASVVSLCSSITSSLSALRNAGKMLHNKCAFEGDLLIGDGVAREAPRLQRTHPSTAAGRELYPHTVLFYCLFAKRKCALQGPLCLCIIVSIYVHP